jgi:hypothetical protein
VIDLLREPMRARIGAVRPGQARSRSLGLLAPGPRRVAIATLGLPGGIFTPHPRRSGRDRHPFQRPSSNAPSRGHPAHELNLYNASAQQQTFSIQKRGAARCGSLDANWENDSGGLDESSVQLSRPNLGAMTRPEVVGDAVSGFTANPANAPRASRRAASTPTWSLDVQPVTLPISRPRVSGEKVPCGLW